ncbi:release factor glutamine methyltransferase [Scopulibacillus darangshiensis]|uniref:Release factor glutamine methyltransferase n=1 Tax=Scopulibacillus darangshiensis TaxID=442528 RepID=A0A4R2NFX3_9BACL|nr:peptide chain release factor N(5)-glutamine methyltransferase [Scopulibacillus darangshiensis]TCP20243.1 release factor glutamine methyltransferase [Scopulibacillus darangshiensis]
MTVKRYEALNWASSFLREHSRDENAGELLLMSRLGLSRTALLTGIRDSLNEADWAWLQDKVKEHGESGTPIQHMIGSEWFYGRQFKVTGDVLIPRPETEELIQGVLKWGNDYFLEKGELSICDIGTGSGAIAVTLALEKPDAKVTAVDLSGAALNIAKNNADALGASVRFVQGSFLEPFCGKETFDIVVSNPPYISYAEMDELGDVVKNHEPHLALAGGEDGLDCYRDIVRQLPGIMAGRLLLAFEIGPRQGDAVSSLIQKTFAGSIKALDIKKDINGKDRMVFALMQKGV